MTIIWNYPVGSGRLIINWRQWLSLSPNPSAANYLSGRDRALWALSWSVTERWEARFRAGSAAVKPRLRSQTRISQPVSISSSYVCPPCLPHHHLESSSSLFREEHVAPAAGRSAVSSFLSCVTQHSASSKARFPGDEDVAMSGSAWGNSAGSIIQAPIAPQEVTCDCVRSPFLGLSLCYSCFFFMT